MKNKMFKGFIAAGVCAVSLLFSMTAFGNAGMGIDADKGASMDTREQTVFCMEDVPMKEYIKDEDKVLFTYPKGTVFKMDSVVLRDGKETGWGAAVSKTDSEGGMGNAFFDMKNVRSFNDEEDVETEVTDGKTLTVRIKHADDEKVDFTVADTEVLDALTCNDENGKFVISFRMPEDNTKDGTVTFTVTNGGKKKCDYVVTLHGASLNSYTTYQIVDPE